MARYYDMDKLADMIQAKADTLLAGKEVFLYVANWLELLPPADVVPKSEVEELNRECESLGKTVNEASELIRKLKGKVEEAKAEVAKEIFEEIENALFNNHCLDEWSDYPTPHYYEELKDEIAELKKKYTEE